MYLSWEAFHSYSHSGGLVPILESSYLLFRVILLKGFLKQKHLSRWPRKTVWLTRDKWGQGPTTVTEKQREGSIGLGRPLPSPAGLGPAGPQTQQRTLEGSTGPGPQTYLPEPLDHGVVRAVAVLVNRMLSPVVHIHVAKAAHQQLAETEQRWTGCTVKAPETHTEKRPPLNASTALRAKPDEPVNWKDGWRGTRVPHPACRLGSETREVTRGPDSSAWTDHRVSYWKWKVQSDRPPGPSDLSSVLTDFLWLCLHMPVTLAVCSSEKLSVSIFQNTAPTTAESVLYESKNVSSPDGSTSSGHHLTSRWEDWSYIFLGRHLPGRFHLKVEEQKASLQAWVVSAASAQTQPASSCFPRRNGEAAPLLCRRHALGHINTAKLAQAGSEPPPAPASLLPLCFLTQRDPLTFTATAALGAPRCPRSPPGRVPLGSRGGCAERPGSRWCPPHLAAAAPALPDAAASPPSQARRWAGSARMPLSAAPRTCPLPGRSAQVTASAVPAPRPAHKPPGQLW